MFLVETLIQIYRQGPVTNWHIADNMESSGHSVLVGIYIYNSSYSAIYKCAQQLHILYVCLLVVTILDLPGSVLECFLDRVVLILGTLKGHKE